jgi:uncharacterized YigZ family protein
MIESYKTVARQGKEEFTEKKSVFIGHIKPIETQEQALEFINEIKQEYKGATHNCHAYVNKEGNIVRFSDDGEPQGTAGMPILEVIKRENLTGVVIVVTRFFGGILLGAGGLVRAYAKAAKIAIDSVGIAVFSQFSQFRITIDYTIYNKIQHDFEKYRVRCKEVSFEGNISMTLVIKKDRLEEYKKYLQDISGGKLEITQLQTIYDNDEM